MNDTAEASPPKGTAGSPLLVFAVVALVAAAGIWHASTLATVNDDAFISFRYARQLVHGNGLVYNAGERVEGYTNFLWTVILAAGMAAGADPVWLSIALGMAFHAGTLILACFLSRRLSAGSGGGMAFLPLAAIALALHRDLNVYATSGLETSMETFLVTALFAVTVLRDDARGALLAGLILSAALLTRPDAGVAGSAVAGFILMERKESLRRLLFFSLPVAGLFLPYWIARWAYFGYFYPNAFYAKSISLPYYAQGLEYARLYFTAYYPLLVVPTIVAAAFLASRRLRPSPAPAIAAPGPSIPTPAARRAVRLGALMVLLLTAFIVRIGGDFMFARFFIPVTPVAFVVLELLVRSTRPGWLAAALALLLVAGTAFRYDHFRSSSQSGYIADEWQRYPLASLEETKKTGATLKKYFDGLPVRVAFWGGQARLMYYAEPEVAIEAMTGLTDTVIAHAAIGERGRPGHEKNAPFEYLVDRGVDFLFRPFTPPPGGFALNLIVFDSIAARIVCYRREIMDSLRMRPGVHFQPMPEYLDAYIGDLGWKAPGEVARDYSFFRDFYFRHNEDPLREGAFREFLGHSGVPGPGG